LFYLNNGAWQQISAETRIAEAKKACEILKARPVYANQTNGHAIVDNSHYEAFQKILEAEKPDAVFTHWPIDNHPDHRAIANLTYEAFCTLDALRLQQSAKRIRPNWPCYRRVRHNNLHLCITCRGPNR